MRHLLITILIMLTFTGNAQVIISCPNTKFERGEDVYQIGISLSDTTIKTVYWTILSGTSETDGNAGLAFCFGHPALFDKRIPDSTGVLYIYNPDIIIKRGSGYVWKLLAVAYNPETNQILYRGWEELIFPNVKP